MKFFLSLALVSMMAASAHADDAHNSCAAPNPHTGAAVSIPADDAVHLNPDGSSKYAYEQWYWNAVVIADDGHTYGVETIPFQFAFGFIPTFTVVQIALTDATANTYESQLIFGSGVYPHIANAFDLEASDAGGSFSAIGGGGSDDLSLTYDDGSVVDLHFDGRKNPAPAWHNGQASLVDPVTGTNHGKQFYYNRRSMKVTGSISRPGKREVNILTGDGWYDREFGTVIGTPGSQENNVNWHWVSLHLSNGSDYMLWDMKADDTGNSLVRTINEIGPAPACTEKTITAFSVVGTGATVVNAGPPVTTLDTSVRLTIPEEHLDVIVALLRTNQIIMTGGLFSPFVEGAMVTIGTQNGWPVVGTGYLEQFAPADSGPAAGGCCQGV